MLPPRHKDISAYYERLAQELEDVSNQTRAKSGGCNETAKKLETYVESIRADLKQRAAQNQD